MRSFRVRWPWVLTMCSGVALALSIVDGPWSILAQAGALPPAEMESWDQDPAAAPYSASRLDADPMSEVDAYDMRAEDEVAQTGSESEAEGGCDAEADYSRDGYPYDNYADPDGYQGYSDAMDADAALADDAIGEIGNTASFGGECDWENAAYAFGDGTTADVRDVAMRSAHAAETQTAETSATHGDGYGMEAEYGYSHADAGFTYPEEYFYKYGYRDYNSADPDGEYGYREAGHDVLTETDSIGQIGNTASFGGERDWENAAYAFGDGTTADVCDVAMRSAHAAETQTAETSTPYDYGYGMEGEYGYEYQYPQEKYGYSSMDAEADTAAAPAKVDYEAEYAFDSRYEGEPGELIDYSQWKTASDYDYAEPYACYGENLAAGVESGLELFAARPSDLLTPADQELLQTLETLCEEPSGARRSVLNDYLEGLGFEAIDFAARFEDVTGIETLGLADDLPGTAALLGCFRLVEQGVLGMDESVDLLRRTLRRPSLDWIEGVREITTGAYEERRVQSASQPLTRVTASLLATAWGQVQGTWTGVVDRAAGWDWEKWLSGLEARLASARSASHYEAF